MYKNKSDKELLTLMVQDSGLSIDPNNELVREFAERLFSLNKNEVININNPINLVDFLRVKIGQEKQEFFATVYLNKQNEVITYKELFKGTIDRSLVHPREVFKEAVKCSASRIILAHNHPSGSLNPSTSDIDTTKALVEAGYLMAIPIIDHIIVTDKNYTSIREIMPELF